MTECWSLEYTEVQIENNDKLNSLIRNFNSWGYSHVLILGDFNYPDIKWTNGGGTVRSLTSEAGKFVEAPMDAFLYQHVEFNTRYQINQQANILDLVFTNEENMINNIEVKTPIGKSDHIVVTFEYNCYSESSNDKEIYLYNVQMTKDLQIDWESLLKDKDVEECWNIFSTKIRHNRQKCTKGKNRE